MKMIGRRQTRRSIKQALLCGAFVAAGAIGATAHAQSTAVEELVVTARSREERLIDVPDTITVFNAQRIEAAGIDQLNDFVRLTPGVSLVEASQSPGIALINIRGVGQQYQSEAPVAVVVDGVQTASVTRVRGVLHNEKYMGVSVHGRKRMNLQARPIHVAPEDWIVVEGAWEPLVAREQFEAAARIRSGRMVRGMSDEAMLDRLRELLEQHGFLTGAIIDDAPGVPCATMYVKRFGRLSAAYGRIGYEVRSYGAAKVCEMTDADLLKRLAALLADRGRLSPAVVNGAAGVPHTKVYGERFGTLEEAFRLVGYVSDQERLRQGVLTEGAILTADRRYMVVSGRLFRAPNPHLGARQRARFVKLLAEGRKLAAESRRLKKRGDEQASKRMIRAARVGLGELGPPWWTDGALDYSRCTVVNSPYADDVGLRRGPRGRPRR